MSNDCQAFNSTSAPAPILQARGLIKRYGRVMALDNADFDLLPGEILAVIGDNGAGKSSLIRALSGALLPDAGEIRLNGQPVAFRSPLDARAAGIETVYQTLALSPSLSIADNMFLGRELRRAGPLGSVCRMLDRKAMQRIAREKLTELGLMTVQNINQRVETLSGGQRQGVAVARAAAFGSRVVIMDEPTAALGVKESRRVLELILDVRRRGLSIVLISHNMPHVFEIADRIHIHRLGRRLTVIDPKILHDVGCGLLHDRRAVAGRDRRMRLTAPTCRIFLWPAVSTRSWCRARRRRDAIVWSTCWCPPAAGPRRTAATSRKCSRCSKAHLSSPFAENRIPCARNRPSTFRPTPARVQKRVQQDDPHAVYVYAAGTGRILPDGRISRRRSHIVRHSKRPAQTCPR